MTNVIVQEQLKADIMNLMAVSDDTHEVVMPPTLARTKLAARTKLGWIGC